MMLQLMAQQSRILEQLANPRAVLDTAHGGSSRSLSGPSDQEKLRSTTPEFSKINGPEHPDAGERLFDWLWMLGTEISDICVGAQVWWDRVVASATEAYNRYSKAESSHRINISAA
jgi:hypothetical protein